MVECRSRAELAYIICCHCSEPGRGRREEELCRRARDLDSYEYNGAWCCDRIGCCVFYLRDEISTSGLFGKNRPARCFECLKRKATAMAQEVSANLSTYLVAVLTSPSLPLNMFSNHGLIARKVGRRQFLNPKLGRRKSAPTSLD